MPKISVIVPAYNVENYIEKCIVSLLRQTFQDFELLLVDDGSTDHTPEIFDELKKRDDRITVFHKQNGGLSDARNYALDRMNGEYVTFVDGDDYVADQYLALLYEMINQDNVQISMVRAQKVLVDEDAKPDGGGAYEVLPVSECVKRMLRREGVSHTACGKLYERTIWKELRFPKGRLYEDYLTIFSAYALAAHVGVASTRLYYYVQRGGSIMHNSCNGRTVTIVDATEEVTPQVIGTWPELKEEAVDLQIALCLKCMQQILNSDPKKFLNVQERIKKIVRENAAGQLLSARVPKRDKVKILFFLLGNKPFIRLYNKFDGSIQI